MLKSLYIDNFKSFNDFTIDFERLTVIIGNNSVGKSSLLQALVFLRDSCISTTDKFLSDRGFSVDDIISKFPLSNRRTITFKTVFSFKGFEELHWDITFLVEKTGI